MKINEVIDSSKLEDIVIDAIKDTITILKQSYNTDKISKLNFPLLHQHTKDTFISVYTHIIVTRCFKDINVNHIKFNIGIFDDNHVWYKIKNITDVHKLMHIRLHIERDLFNQVMLIVSSNFFNNRTDEIDYLIENSLKMLNFIEIQVHELTHLEQLVNRLKSKKNDLGHISNLIISNNKKVEKVRSTNNLSSKHFMYPNEMNAYASEISSYIITAYKKELKDSIELFTGLSEDIFKRHLMQLKQNILSKIPELAKSRRWEINDYTKEKIYSTLLKQIYINVERKINNLEEQALDNFDRVYNENN